MVCKPYLLNLLFVQRGLPFVRYGHWRCEEVGTTGQLEEQNGATGANGMLIREHHKRDLCCSCGRHQSHALSG